MPWFSGICLEGEVAGQYEIEPASTPQRHGVIGGSGALALDSLGPITIFVGANNSGKSRLMRALFGNSEAAKCLRMGPDSEELKFYLSEIGKLYCFLQQFQADDKSELREIMPSVESFLADYKHWAGAGANGWTGVNTMSHLYAINASIESYLRNSNNKSSRFSPGGRFRDDVIEAEVKAREAASAKRSLDNLLKPYEAIRVNQFSRRMHDYLSLRRCYVPMLRGMRPPLVPVDSNRQSIDASDCYEERSIIDYFTGFPSWRSLNKDEEDKVVGTQQKQAPAFSEKPRIFSGLSLYHDIQKRLLAPTHEERKSIREYETFLSINFFQGREVTLTPALRNQEGKDNDVVHIKIGESEDRPIYALGDGMQSLIICTYPIITELQRGSLFFLEEPDLCMHPSLQRVFLKVLRDSYINKGHQFFLTTHSNHLLDLLEDDNLVSIFSFSEIADRAPAPSVSSQADSGSNSQSSKAAQRFFRIRPSNLRDRRTLLELGVRPSATYLANATIWVEGVSDCAYLRAYMKAFVNYLKVRGNYWGERLAQRLEQYKEDRHYAFVEYSGANLTHFSFKDEDCDEGPGQDASNTVTRVSDLCSKAVVIADGDITESNKGDRWIHFARQLNKRFISLPCKEIENLIPDALMQMQLQREDSTIDVKSLPRIKYVNYRKMHTGVGTYLSKHKFIKVMYAGKSGTLNSYRKKKWSSNDNGIPSLVLEMVERDKKRDSDGIENQATFGKTQSIEEALTVPDLPRYLTQDLIWLSVCLYAHITECNHDQNALKMLQEFQEFIKHQAKGIHEPISDSNGDSQPYPESDNIAEAVALEWPIKDVNCSCLLTSFLRELNKAE